MVIVRTVCSDKGRKVRLNKEVTDPTSLVAANC